MSFLLMIVQGPFSSTHFEINQTSILVFFFLRSMLTAKIKSLQTDGGGVFTSQKLQS